MRRAIVLTAAICSFANIAQAEENARFRTAVSVVGGLSVGSTQGAGLCCDRFGLGGYGRSDTGFAVGGGIAHDLNSRLTLEATGLYLDRDASAWSADAGFRLNLTPASHSVVPYFAVSGGVYSERSRGFDVGPWVDLVDDAFEGRPGRGSMLPGLPGAVGEAVEAARAAAARSLEGTRRTDGLLSLGGGVRFEAGPHVFVRPDVRAQLVFSGDTRVLGLFTLNFGYRF